MKPPFEYHAGQSATLAEQSCHTDGWYITDAAGVVIFSQHEPPPLDLAREICARLEDRERAQASLRKQERAWHEVLRECDEARRELVVEKKLELQRLHCQEIDTQKLENQGVGIFSELEKLQSDAAITLLRSQHAFCHLAGTPIKPAKQPDQRFTREEIHNIFFQEPYEASRREKLMLKNKREAYSWGSIIIATATLCLANVIRYISEGNPAMACGVTLAGIFVVYISSQARKSYLP